MIDLFIFIVIVIQQGMSQTTIPYWVGTVSKKERFNNTVGLHKLYTTGIKK